MSKKKLVLLVIMTFNAAVLFLEMRSEPTSRSLLVIILAAAFLGFTPLPLIFNESGLPSFFSFKALRVVDETSPIVVRFIGWVILVTVTGISVFSFVR